MGDLSLHFSRREFACKCLCGQDSIDYQLVRILERLRKFFGTPIVISSGNRCEEHNEAEGGAPDSQHLLGKAADIQVKGASPTRVYDLLDEWYPDRYGLIEYKYFTHFDVREGMWRQR